MAAKKKKDTKISGESVVAKSDDGTIQITLSIPFEKIQKAREKAALELGKEIEVPGFRKGKAPIDKVISQASPQTLLEKTLLQILPELFATAVSKNKLKPAIYPKFELIKSDEGENWEVRAQTCELPEIELGEYKKSLKGALSSKKIWTPDKGSEKKDTEPTNEEKEQQVIKTLLDTIKVKVPKIIIDEDVNQKLSQLLARLEKLGLTLESYLSSIGKNPETLREDYEKQAQEVAKLDLILARIADQEKITIKKEKVDETIKASSADENLAKNLDTPEQRRYIESVLRKRAVINHLTSLV